MSRPTTTGPIVSCSPAARPIATASSGVEFEIGDPTHPVGTEEPLPGRQKGVGPTTHEDFAWWVVGSEPGSGVSAVKDRSTILWDGQGIQIKLAAGKWNPS